MAFTNWRRPHRVQIGFVGVAVVSIGVLAWLTALLLRQDAALESRSRQQRLDDAAGRTQAIVERSLADLQTLSISSPDEAAPVPAGVSLVTLTDDGVRAERGGRLLYYPRPDPPISLSSGPFEEAESLEFGGRLAAALPIYARMAQSADPAVRAGALLRLARSRRNANDVQGAIAAFEQLAALDAVRVEESPAALLAASGLATIYARQLRQADLQRVGSGMEAALRDGRWRLTRDQYVHYRGAVGNWLGRRVAEDPDALVRSAAIHSLWQNRASLTTASRQALSLPEGTAYAFSSYSGRVWRAAAAGPRFLASLCTSQLSAGFGCAITDGEGRPVDGGASPPQDALTRSLASMKLPWTLHVFPNGASAEAPASRRPLLLLVLGIVGIVLIAGSYFSMRAVSRELKVGRLQSDFVAAVSHEFRTPLSTVCQVSEMLAQDRFPTDALRRQAYDVLHRDTDRLRRLVEGLLDFKRFEAGGDGFCFERVDVAELVRTVIADFQRRVAAEGYTIELTDDVGEVVLLTDREAIARALWNLLDNAVKYSPNCRTVWVDMQRDTTHVTIVVRDRGLGIPLREQREIFEPFVRGAESRELRIKGTGIGLAMVRQILEAHGGEVRLASAPGEGSRFSLVLPAAREVA